MDVYGVMVVHFVQRTQFFMYASLCRPVHQFHSRQQPMRACQHAMNRSLIITPVQCIECNETLRIHVLCDPCMNVSMCCVHVCAHASQLHSTAGLRTSPAPDLVYNHLPVLLTARPATQKLTRTALATTPTSTSCANTWMCP